MRRNETFAGLTAVVIATLTLAISFSPIFWVVAAGSFVLVAGFSMLSKLESLWGPANPRHYRYVVPMVVGPALGGLLRGTSYAVWVGVPVGLICGVVAYLLVMKFPPFTDPGADEEEIRDLESQRIPRF